MSVTPGGQGYPSFEDEAQAERDFSNREFGAGTGEGGAAGPGGPGVAGTEGGPPGTVTNAESGITNAAPSESTPGIVGMLAGQMPGIPAGPMMSFNPFAGALGSFNAVSNAANTNNNMNALGQNLGLGPNASQIGLGPNASLSKGQAGLNAALGGLKGLGVPGALASMIGLNMANPSQGKQSQMQMQMTQLAQTIANEMQNPNNLNPSIGAKNVVDTPDEAAEAADEGDISEASLGEIGINTGIAAPSGVTSGQEAADAAAANAPGPTGPGIASGNQVNADNSVSAPVGTVEAPAPAIAGGTNAPGTVSDVSNPGAVGEGGVGGPGSASGASGGTGSGGEASAPHKGAFIKKGSKPRTGGLKIGGDEDRDGRKNVPAMLEEGETVVPAGKRANDAKRRYKIGGMGVGGSRGLR